MKLVILINLELELVESVAPRETPRGLEVFAEVVDLLDGRDESVVDGLDGELASHSLRLPTTTRKGNPPRRVWSRWSLLTFCSDFLASGTSTFCSPSPKNWPSLLALTPLGLAKNPSLTDSGTETEAMSTLVEVAIT